MALPKYDELYEEILAVLSENGEQNRSQLRDRVADLRGLTPEERAELLPSSEEIPSFS